MRKKPTHLKTVLALVSFACFANAMFAQKVDPKAAMDLIRKNASVIGLSRSDLLNSRISDAYTDKVSGATMVYLQQTYKGVDVFNSIQSLAFKGDKVVSLAGGRIAKLEELANVKSGKAARSVADAVRDAATHLKLATPSFLTAAKQINTNEFEFGALGISSVNVKSKLIWLPDETIKTAVLTWQVEVQPAGVSDYWLVNVDATKGGVINKINLNVSCNWITPAQQFMSSICSDFVQNNFAADGEQSIEAINSAKYKVIKFPAESPSHPGGTPAVHKNPWNLAGAGNDATTLKWNDNGTVTFDSTRGNNVLAQEDRNGNNGSGIGGHSTTPAPDLSFVYNPNFTQEPTTATNQQFALTNLFYWNNIVHDLSYQYGFDEASGNFQANNLGRGGLGNDYVFADAQDGSGSDNANFATPPDGSSPRMQMFLFSAVPTLTVNKPLSFKGKKAATESGFSINNKLANVGPVTGRVILYADDAGNTTHKACVPPFNASQLSGKIALIDRGDCSFTIKVKNAQNAGAEAAIVIDNVPGEYPIIMGGTDNTITIPAVMVSFETGEDMKQILATNDTALTVTMSGGVRIDGDLDNGVITHEYTHGISNRLTGGANNVSCLQNKEQMGEGWSDYLALMTTTDWGTATVNDGPNRRPIGTYALGQTLDGPGIRYYPYSTNFNVNPWTYDSMALSSRFSNNLLLYSPHAVGEVWCNMLWEMTWELIKSTNRINPNIYRSSTTAGNIVALQLVIEGMKLQPCSPGFVDGRNAILKADTILYGASHSADIWRAFARRGLGVNANQASTNNIKDGTADYSVPSFAPIAQSEFNAVKQSNTALLQWNVSNTSASKFVIERSTDGSAFNEIGTVTNDKGVSMYNFVDHLPSKGTNYYRLRNTTVSGSVAYSAVRALSFNVVNIAPNPAKDKITITISGNNKPLKVSIVSATGKQIITYNMSGENLNAKLPLLAQGMYYIQIKGEGISDTQKLIIQ